MMVFCDHLKIIRKSKNTHSIVDKARDRDNFKLLQRMKADKSAEKSLLSLGDRIGWSDNKSKPIHPKESLKSLSHWEHQEPRRQRGWA